MTPQADAVQLLVIQPEHATIATEQSVAHGAAGRADSEVDVVRRGPVNGNVVLNTKI